jgi:hypothetical protein
MIHFKETEYGFEFGAMEVVRIYSDEEKGVLIEIRTPKNLLTVRATKTGHLRVSDVVKVKKLKAPK